MAKNNQFRGQQGTASNSANVQDAASSSPEIDAVLRKVKQLLDDGATDQASHLLTRYKNASPWVTNAIGVCLLRTGNAKQATTLFQGLVSQQGIRLRPEAPTLFKTNFATALLASDNLAGCLSVLHEISDEENPAVQRLRAAVAAWKKNLPLLRKLQWYLGDYPEVPVTLDFPLGDLE